MPPGGRWAGAVAHRMRRRPSLRMILRHADHRKSHSTTTLEHALHPVSPKYLPPSLPPSHAPPTPTHPLTPARFEEAIKAGRISAVEAIRDCCVLAAVGQKMASRRGVAATMFAALAKANINVRCGAVRCGTGGVTGGTVWFGKGQCRGDMGGGSTVLTTLPAWLCHAALPLLRRLLQGHCPGQQRVQHHRPH